MSPRFPDDYQQAARIRASERNVGLPVKAVVIGVLFYYLYLSNWFDDVTGPGEGPLEVALEVVRLFFVLYVVLNLFGSALLIGMDWFPLGLLHWIIFTLGCLDGLFLAAMIAVTGGFDSSIYWAAVGLVIRNAVSILPAIRQIVTNLLVTVAFGMAGMVDVHIKQLQAELLDPQFGNASEISELLNEPATEPVVLRIVLLLLVTFCSYGISVLVEKKRKAEEETQELALRQEQLTATGRLAAEIAHQLKNPLGIINNAAFSLQQDLRENQVSEEQIEIIREEVSRSDQILTELMGYARLAEGRVERVDLGEELDRAILQVFPPAMNYPILVHRRYAKLLPPLLIERGHLSEVFVNILQNAREAMNGEGTLWASAEVDNDGFLEVKVRDTGPGVAPEYQALIFESYYTTKKKGTGLGLAIANHNTELYHGTIMIESELGEGTEFQLRFPPRIMINSQR